ncbi:MAG: coiled-coil domain-containing protein [Sphingomonadaceae bacterium]
MTTATFDTLSVAKRLQAAGFTPDQAKAMTAVVSEASDPASRELVTKKDLQIELAPLKADIGLLKWMAGVNSALTVGVLLKLFLS